MKLTAIFISALAGLVSAAAVDLDAWSKHPGQQFDWYLAVRRWILAGILAGGAAGTVGSTLVGGAA